MLRDVVADYQRVLGNDHAYTQQAMTDHATECTLTGSISVVGVREWHRHHQVSSFANAVRCGAAVSGGDRADDRQAQVDVLSRDEAVRVNPHAHKSDKWYQTQTMNGKTGYIAEVYLEPKVRPLSLPPC
jgi:hypothetical protein